jgi:hypothetical protein
VGNDRPDLLHDVDKRLAVLEALTKSEAANNCRHRQDMQEQLAEIKKSVDSLKIRVAGFSAGVSIIAFFVAQAVQGIFR